MRLKIKNILFFLLFLITLNNLSATTYYLSNTGNDGALGTSSATPWQTITKLNNSSSLIVAGDSVLFKRGDSFVGTIRIKSDGTAGNEIVFSAYGTGNDPIITGLVDVTVWTNKGGNIWESTNAVSSLNYANYVIVKGISTPMGRFPNGNGLPSNPYMGDSSWIYDNSFGSGYVVNNARFDSTVIDWTGGQLVTRPKQYIIKVSAITNHISDTIYYTSGSNWSESGSNGGLFIQQHLSTLDVANEWYYNPSTKKLSIYSAAAPIGIKISTVDTLINVSGSYVKIENLEISGANKFGIYTSGKHHIYIFNCNIEYCTNGIYAYNGSSVGLLDIEENTISNCNNNGISLLSLLESYYGFTNSTIKNNTISKCGLIPGMGFNSNGDPTHCGIATELTTACTVQYNSIDSVGYCGISMVMPENALINYNFINYYNLILHDGGGIYTNGSTTYREISNNIVLNGKGNLQGLTSYHDGDSVYGYVNAHGIYIDDGGNSDNTLIKENTVAFNSFSGLFWGKATNCTWINNTLYENRFGIYNTGLYSHLPSHIQTIKYNIVFNNGDTAIMGNNAMGTINYPCSGTYSPNIDMDYNYYCRPKDQDNVIYVYYSSHHHRPLSYWQTISGKDKHSKGFDVPISNPDTSYFYYNPSKYNLLISLPEGKQLIDIFGMRYRKYAVLKPYTSIILMDYGGTKKL